MIRFSNKIKYGLQFLLFLNVDEEEFTDIQRAAISCNIPHKFLESIAVSLKKGGTVVVKRGAGGGYRLNRAPEEITLAEVVKAIEGIESGKDNIIKDIETTREVVEEVLDSVMTDFWQSLENITLKQLHQKYYDRTDKIMYYI
ncbi:RrF2 family transcriptional regulator [Alkalitalea saponilacus]|uniref:Transcriptional regulator, BadM/Rrf2 family n=1 Tax=Alkalitalea saponilacus TaxID=889453 RepID=A0A1T5HHP9_9BACT|nr:Rrf2 family transcriptional regulator [Alkalitalea saponilacus]ASB48150.1 transcriptional regulator [Alkalitalea saponilacus]SKC20207.1 transcriptional regulator, BadM/Rrf2 family [Alkalitalea saponilacus]